MSDTATIIPTPAAQPARDKAIMGNNLKHYRCLLRMTQEQLSEKADCSTSTISRVECGDIYMSVDLLLRISEALCTSCDALLKPPCKDVRILNICNMLQNCTDSFVEMVEQMIITMGISPLST